MGKGAIRFGGKSGVLPKPRQIFKQPYKHEVYVKAHDTGYADGIIHPRGTTRDLIRPEVFTPEQRLKKTAKLPNKKYSEVELGQMPEAQRYKVKNAEMRRQYLKESYEGEVKRLERLESYQKKLSEERKKIEEEAQKHEKSKAELYTIPTVESYLKGPLMKLRTEEETETLKLKREANRLAQEMKVKEERAIKLMELYNASSDFAITEGKLELLVDEAFSDRKLKEVSKLLNINPDRLGTLPTTIEFENSLKDVILGNVNRGPSYEVVEDTLSGFNDEVHEIAERGKEEKKIQMKQEAEEKQKKLQELQDEMVKDREEASN
ncbi:DEKNAAC102102 [Brettanomyces naardenensis]|uniref:DEKNAAC102102 n=1 Tax=Brettanomyces naardenensis TaxID=13370 RepID=A0A448YK02_BRENA|nr:DEKNAAC102102 [Brettanomyces naardenensis]